MIVGRIVDNELTFTNANLETVEACKIMQELIGDTGSQTVTLYTERETGSNYRDAVKAVSYWVGEGDDAALAEKEALAEMGGSLHEISGFVFGTGSQCRDTDRAFQDILDTLKIDHPLIGWDSLLTARAVRCNWAFINLMTLMSSWAYLFAKPLLP